MKPGWIRIFRKITDCDWYWDKPFDRTHAFLDLLLMAAWEEKKVIRNKRQIVLLPGEIVTDMTSLGERWGMERRKVARLLESLVFLQVICLRKNNAYTLISIINWNRYQQNGTADGIADGTADGTADGGDIGGERREEDKEIERETTCACACTGEETGAEKQLWIQAEEIRDSFPRIGNLHEDVLSVVAAIRREADKPGCDVGRALETIRTAAAAYADAVRRWPPEARRFISTCKKWFDSGRYLESSEMWRQDTTAPVKKFNVLDESTWS